MLDTTILHLFEGVRTASGVSFFSYLTYLGSPVGVAVLSILLLVYLWKSRMFTYLVPYIVALLGSTVCMYLIKYLVARPRPLGAVIAETGYSFPSGHATGAFVLYGFLIYIASKHMSRSSSRYALQVILALLIISIGVSRLYLGVHFFSDVLAGYLLGCLWLMLSAWWIKKNDAVARVS